MHTKFLTRTTNRGFALLLSIIISSVVLAIGVSLLHLSVSQINLASSARESEIAFQAAHAGVDCLWYWRYTDATEASFVTPAPAGAPVAPAVSCFGGGQDLKSYARRGGLSALQGYIDKFSYEFTWGDSDRCSQVDMYIMHPAGTSGIVNHSFLDVNEGIGTLGSKSCEAGNLCTVIVSRGYNRECSEVGNSIFTIQRELTVEF